MNVHEYLITCLIEEAGEVIQACTKILRFGRNDRRADDEDTNEDKLLKELLDMAAIVEMLIETKRLTRFGVTTEEGAIQRKKDKVAKYMGISSRKGCLTFR